MTPTQDDLLEFARLVRWLTGRKLTQTDADVELRALHAKYAPEPYPIETRVFPDVHRLLPC